MRAYADCHFSFSVSLSDRMVRIPEQSGQYLLSLIVIGRWDRDWGGGLWFVTSGSMGRSGGQLQGFCPVGIRGAVEWGGGLAGMGRGLKLFLSLSNPS